MAARSRWQATSVEPRARHRAARAALLGELFVGAQLITHAQLAEALLQQSSSGKRIGTLLVELGAITEQGLAQVLSEQLDIPLVDLSQTTPTPEAVEVLPETVARAHLAVPITLDENAVTIAGVRPEPGHGEDPR